MSKQDPASAREEPAQPYCLHTLFNFNDVQLRLGDSADVCITCVEFWEGNLYVGTSNGEVLHFVSVSSEPSRVESNGSFIEASRLHPEFVEPGHENKGIQQILILQRAGKACVLCNDSLTFYSLPELTPAYGGSLKISKCAWVGGLDLDLEVQQQDDEDGPVVMVCLDDRIRVVKIAERPRAVRSLELPGCVTLVRRGAIVCAADAGSYSLLDVEEQQRIPLFDVSSAPSNTMQVQNVDFAESRRRTQEATDPNGAAASSSPGRTSQDGTTEQLDTSGPENLSENRSDNPVADLGLNVTHYPLRSSSLARSSSSSSRPLSSASVGTQLNSKPAVTSSSDKTLELQEEQRPGHASKHLRPHIASPSSTEFLLVTGRHLDEPGVGMFVNIEGDVVRGTIEFSRYPESVVVDRSEKPASDVAPKLQSSGFVLSAMTEKLATQTTTFLEIQKWDTEPGEQATKHRLNVKTYTNSQAADPPPNESKDACIGLRETVSRCHVSMPNVIAKLSLEPLSLRHHFRTSELDHSELSKRQQGELDLIRQLSQISSQILLWLGKDIWWAVRTPLVILVDERLERCFLGEVERSSGFVDRQIVEHVVSSVRKGEVQSELDFLTLKYIRQKASLLLFMDLLRKTSADVVVYDKDHRSTLEALIDGEIDPRAVLALLPTLREEISYGQGIWLQGGLVRLLRHFSENVMLPESMDEGHGFSASMLPLVLSYLQFWRRRKGFGSISDEKPVFESVDAALLHILLTMEKSTLSHSSVDKTVRSELNAMVDGEISCFDRAVELLEAFKRLYLLSRLYHSRKMSKKVLETWQRILNGEPEDGGEHGDLEQRMRKYLRDIRDATVVEDYGIWLAQRSPKVGVLVFTDENSKATFRASDALQILYTRAPGAIKDFLEHLVFDKNLSAYANDLIQYYLDSLIGELGSSPAARASLLASYKAYKTLSPPKPSYSQYATDNALPADWWSYRLRLLQLLGGDHPAASQYDVAGTLQRIEQYKDELVPEMIILDGRQSRHQEALQLLTHQLGDFDTAVMYCLLGGTNTYSPIAGPRNERRAVSREEQSALFARLLEELINLEDLTDRMDQTSEVLERFALWFDVYKVLAMIPENWSVRLLSIFLKSTLRQLVTGRNDSAIERALANAGNMTAAVQLADKLGSMEPFLEHAT
ncbi:MAG: hypothetical protein M1828_002503 [Chrysothrix sp. TS-e1954]|nr:MAG: hypothetical protein M1828_002503 [Chrysothrix sp. TS-e1954]